VSGNSEVGSCCTDAQSRDPRARFRSSGSADAILALVKAGAKVEASDKDGLTGEFFFSFLQTPGWYHFTPGLNKSGVHLFIMY